MHHPWLFPWALWERSSEPAVRYLRQNLKMGFHWCLSHSPIFSVSLVCVPTSWILVSSEATHLQHSLNSIKWAKVSPGFCLPSHLMFHLLRPLKILLLPWGLFFPCVVSCTLEKSSLVLLFLGVDLRLPFLAKVQIWPWIMWSECPD